MSVFGTCVAVSLFGESHGKRIGATIHHLPAGIPIDVQLIEAALSRRRPVSEWSSERREPDRFEWVSGLYAGRTTGAPLTILIDNADLDSTGYDEHVPRPGHGDYPIYVKYRAMADHRGGGHLSGRLTAALVAAGEIARQALLRKNIRVLTQVRRVGDVLAPSLADCDGTEHFLESLENADFPVISETWRTRFENRIREASDRGDSVGGETETIVFGVEAGIGEPFFDSVESVLSHLLFGIPGVKGVAFGKGFALAEASGSKANDPIRFDPDGHVVFQKNDMGGILGGISSGQAIYFSTAFKPTPTVKIPQKTINLQTSENIVHRFDGRHDACIVPRAAHVVTAVTYIGFLELIARNEGIQWTL